MKWLHRHAYIVDRMSTLEAKVSW